jgi:hypothetical protein
MSDRAPAGCYLWPWPRTALPLWNDDASGAAHGPGHNLSKAAKRNVHPEVVAAFSGIDGAVAEIVERGAGPHWVITRRSPRPV